MLIIDKKLGNVGGSTEMLLFRGMVHTNIGEQLRKKEGIRYTRVRGLVYRCWRGLWCVRGRQRGRGHRGLSLSLWQGRVSRLGLRLRF